MLYIMRKPCVIHIIHHLSLSHLHLGLCFNFLKPTRCNNPSHQNENEKTRRRQTVGTLQKKLVLAAAAAAAAAAPLFLFQLQFT